MSRVVWAILFVCLGATAAQAQEAKKMSLKDAVDVALENNLRIKRGVYNVETFKANMLQAKGAFLPSFNAFGSYTNNYGRALNPTTNLFVDRNSTTISPSVSGSLPLFNGLRIQSTYRQTQRDLLASNHDLQKAKNDVILNVVTLYINVIFNKELMDNARYQLNSSQQQLDRIKKQVEAGSLSMSNQLNQDAQVATNELNLINQENALNLSILQLKQAMQVPASEQIDVEIPDIAADDLVLDSNAEGIYQVALESMPEIRSAILKVESANFALRANQGGYLPRLTLGSTISSNSSDLNTLRIPTGTSSQVPIGTTASGEIVYTSVNNVSQEKYTHNNQLSDNVFKNVSLQLNIPILNGFSTRSNVQRARINKEVAEISVKEAQNTLRQSIETAYNDAVAAARSYNASQRTVQAQEEAFRMNKQRFDVGALSIIEYQVSENDLYRAKSDQTRAKYNFVFKKKVLDFYQGKPIEY